MLLRGKTQVWPRLHFIVIITLIPRLCLPRPFPAALPQNCHSEERHRPPKNPFTPQQVIPEVKRPLAKLGATGGDIHGAMLEAKKSLLRQSRFQDHNLQDRSGHALAAQRQFVTVPNTANFTSRVSEIRELLIILNPYGV